MSGLENSSVDLEIRRIARLVGVTTDRLAGLEGLPVEDLRTLRGQVAVRLFDEGADSWERVVAVSRVVPSGLSAKLAQGALGPVLAARVTSMVDIDKATDIARRLPAAFMADTAVNIDPRQVTELIVHLPPDVIAEVGEVLAEREEWLVMADFVAALTPSALQSTVETLDEEAIVQIAVLLEEHDRVTAVIGMLDDDRLVHLRAVVEERDLQAHLAHLRAVVDAAQRDRLAA